MGEGILIYGVRNKYTRTLQEFANKVLARGTIHGSIYSFGQMSKAILSELAKRGVKIQSTEAIIMDKTILKYKIHPKKSKNAVVSFNRFIMVEKAVKKPKGVFIDTRRSRLVFVSSVKYSKNQVLKVVIDPNQKKGKKFFNQVKSIGVVSKNSLVHPQYKRIK